MLNACVKAKPDEPLSFMVRLSVICSCCDLVMDSSIISMNILAQARELFKIAPPEILSIVGRQIIDSRGNPTVEAGETYDWRF